MNRLKIYRFVENVTPPFLFRLLKNSILHDVYKKIYRPVPAQTIEITEGILKGSKLKLNPKGDWQKMMIDGTYDHELFTFINEKYKIEGKTVYDIGAHIGYHSLVFGKLVGKTGHVYAFEPNPANAARAEEIFSLNPDLEDRIKLFNAALSNETGTTTFLSTDNIEGGTSSGGFIESATPIWEKTSYTKKIGFKLSEVPLETIDSMITSEKIKAPDLMKIDVEGAEHLVLEGAKELLQKYRPTILVELHSIYASYATTSVLLKFKYTTEIIHKEEDGRIMLLAFPPSET